MQVRKRPVVVEARQTGVDYDIDCEILAWSGGKLRHPDETEPNELFVIPTLEGQMVVSSGDWVIQGVKGEFYPCKPDIFAESYEEVTV
ncbi:hypothetical protein SEA_FRANSOYER_60 [Microbacterium phage Fransoyer]|nr:hypothetical protein SEA_SADLAD_63 [Microbacterium phage SadLad]UUG69625.1 hypothetical protein SEA_FRANSOYER_60 [Microbacterium phage Fransoyer]